MDRLVPWKHLLIALVALLFVARVAVELTGRGAPYWRIDFRTLWREESTFYARIYPHADVTPPPPGRSPVRSDYPPYSLPLFALLLPPGWGIRKAAVWFTMFEVLAVAVLVAYAWARGRAIARASGWLLAGSVLVMTGLRADLLFGNIAVITTALLLGLFWSIERDHWWSAAGFWGAAMLKPQMGWLFALLFSDRRRWRPLATGIGLLVVLALAACWWTNVDLVRVLGAGTSRNWSIISHVGERYSLVTLLVTAGVAPTVALAGGAIAAVAISTWRLHGPLMAASALQRFAFLALVNRICTYHNVCDDLLLVFPLIWLGLKASETERSTDWVAFVVLGVSVWLPTAALSTYTAKVVIIAIWAMSAMWVSAQAEKRISAAVLASEAD